MDFVDAIEACFKKYVDFNGRARPAENWWFLLFIMVGSIVIGIVSETLSLLFSLATFIPYTAVVSRRLHDINLSGWFQLWWSVVGLIGCICFAFGFVGLFFGESERPSMAIGGVGLLLLLASFALFVYYMVKAGNTTDNQYGPPPAN
jgi:uncharacterized membrane protein YhaH (DUF805 family)